MPAAGFEPAIPASERPQTHVLDRTTAGIGHSLEVSGSYLGLDISYADKLSLTFLKYPWQIELKEILSVLDVPLVFRMKCVWVL
jgi:hypothetical protein